MTGGYYRKKDLNTVAATIRNTQAPNQLPAVFPVSGSPDENFEYTRMAPIRPQSAPAAYISLVAGSKYPVTICVACTIPADPSPAAKARTERRTANKGRSNLPGMKCPFLLKDEKNRFTVECLIAFNIFIVNVLFVCFQKTAGGMPATCPCNHIYSDMHQLLS
jgi:hypothetical protein